jgi:AcrR family transcriptional regulator
MARWEPNARERLLQAALEAFAEHGYDGTTVEQIAARAGLTERTFFRYFADKREVLFAGAADLRRLISDVAAGAPPESSPMEAVAAALEAVAEVLPRSRERARARQALIVAHPELREREVMKMSALAGGLVEALRDKRGVPEPAASLSAEAGIAVFKVAWQCWLDEEGRGRELVQHIRAGLAELRAVVVAGAPSKPRARRKSA